MTRSSGAAARHRSGPWAWVPSPALLALLALLALSFGMPWLRPLFAAAFPALDRPVYEQDSFAALLAAHVGLVATSSLLAVIPGVAAGIFVTRPVGREFRRLADAVVSIAQAMPPVAVLALAVPVLGFGAWPAVIALALYGVLPVLRGTVAGLESVPPAAVEAATGLGMNGAQRLARIELPLALPVLLAGVRTSVVINIGTATLASTVGVASLGSPIIVGLNGFNTAYVIQGALLVGLLAITVDLGFDRLGRRLTRWQTPG